MVIDEVLTIGVEEEFVLVDRNTGLTVPCAAQVVAEAGTGLGERVGEEFYAAQLEIRSAPALRATAVRADLAEARSTCADAASRLGAALVGSGCSVMTTERPRLTDTHRYRDIAHRLGSFVQATESELSGCHVHLGTLDRGEALALSAGLRPWLPVLQALCANSPFAAGREHGWASWRAARYAQWPTVGPAPVLDTLGYEALAGRMVAAGEIRDRAMIYWYARPSERWPTLEVRLCDVNADLDLDLLLAVLLRGLGTVLLAEARAGVPLREHVGDTALLEAHEQAGRFGLRGRVPDPVTGDRRPLALCLATLVERAGPGLRAAGDDALAAELVDRVRRHGNGADRQRASFDHHGDLFGVVTDLANATTAC
ncbi:carboxylate-amine ligase [Streptacidiphilus jiangxiensis]|uniref:Putative glutamate--cysteine ligase 2 n=1 Tax=Streptacidiphilus jiangxiensis TaxID=235985 RepID=A0A1H7H6F6_STRJI|nr:YbdK family carboxylate-amine ligase [Streptacidiphilus jiangxiensis]SEK44872.1 carboxylate-amine ligase [Streptacidiphilus jiangxiensis]